MPTIKFWVIMGTNGLSHSPYRHYNEQDAFKEAERLSRMHGGTFFVMESKGAARRVDVQVERFNGGEEIPF